MQTFKTTSDRTAQSARLRTAALVALFLAAGSTAAVAQVAPAANATFTIASTPVLAGSSELTSDPRIQDDDSLARPWRDVKAGAEFVSTSAYVWRGFVPGTTRSTQTNSWVRFKHLTLSSWMNVSPDRTRVTEHDFTMDYTASTGSVSWSAGYINYVFPGSSSDGVSHELYAGAAHTSYFNPSLRVYRDFGAGSGTYVNASVSHAFELPWQQVLVTPSAALGYNHRQWIDASTFSDLNVGVKAAWVTPIRRVTIAPFINYSKSLVPDQFASRFYWGLGLTVN